MKNPSPSSRPEYTFVVGHGFLPTDPLRQERRSITSLAQITGILLFFLSISSFFFHQNVLVSIWSDSGSLLPTLLSRIAILLLTSFLPFLFLSVICPKSMSKSPARKRVRPVTMALLFFLILGLSAVGMSISLGFPEQTYLFWWSSTGSLPLLSRVGGVGDFCLYALSFCILPPLLFGSLFYGIFLRFLRPYGNLFAATVVTFLYLSAEESHMLYPFTILLVFSLSIVTLYTGDVKFTIGVHCLINLFWVIAFWLRPAYASALPLPLIVFLFVAGALAIFGLSLLFRRLPRSSCHLSIWERFRVFLTSPVFLLGLSLLIASLITTAL